MSELVASQLSCIKRDRLLFESLSVTLKSGQLIHLRGPNGAGKTSLLRILAGLSQPDAGFVLWDDKPLGHSFVSSMVFQGHKVGLSSNLSALDNLRFWCAQHSVKTDESKIYAVLEHLSLVGMEDIPVRLLSAGQQRRVALARLWLKPALVWILDEPFTALDTSGINVVEDYCIQFVEQGGMIIMTSHQPLNTPTDQTTFMDMEFQS